MPTIITEHTKIPNNGSHSILRQELSILRKRIEACDLALYQIEISGAAQTLEETKSALQRLLRMKLQIKVVEEQRDVIFKYVETILSAFDK